MISPCIPMALYGSAIPATASCRIMKATKRHSRCLPTFIVSIRRRARSPSSSATWISPTVSAFLPMKNCSTSSTPAHQNIPRTHTRSGCTTSWMARASRTAACSWICLRAIPTASVAIWTATSGRRLDGSGENYNGVHVFAPDGTLIGKIHLPETCANLCFGGAKKNRLFMAASQSLYAVYVGTEGAQLP